MDEAAPQAAERTAGDGVRQALDALRAGHGGKFMIGHDEQGYWAARHGQIGKIVRAAAPEELAGKMSEAGR